MHPGRPNGLPERSEGQATPSEDPLRDRWIEIRNGHLWALRDGKALSLWIFPEPEKALEAAGLRE